MKPSISIRTNVTREIAIAHEAQIHHGFRMPQLPPDEQRKSGSGDQHQRGDERGTEPVILLTAIEHDLQAAEAQADEPEADPVHRDSWPLSRATGCSLISAMTRNTSAMPTGTLIRNIQRQL